MVLVKRPATSPARRRTAAQRLPEMAFRIERCAATSERCSSVEDGQVFPRSVLHRSTPS